MVKYLFNLLTCHHFLNKAVDIAKLLLLSVVIFLAAFTIVFDKNEHKNEKHNNNHSQSHTQNHHHSYSSKKGKKALDYHRKTIVHCFLNRVNIISEMTHNLTMCIIIKIF